MPGELASGEGMGQRWNDANVDIDRCDHSTAVELITLFLSNFAEYLSDHQLIEDAYIREDNLSGCHVDRRCYL
jgi:hypothetical protein